MCAIPEGVYELKLGKSLAPSSSNKSRNDYHSIRYDFKPKSVSADSAETYMAMTENDDVQIAFANADNDALTLYKCASKPSKDGKECLLIFDADSKEMRLEKLISNFNMKQTRGTDLDMESQWRTEIERVRQTNPQRYHQHHHKSSETLSPPPQADEADEPETEEADEESKSSSGGHEPEPEPEHDLVQEFMQSEDEEEDESDDSDDSSTRTATPEPPAAEPDASPPAAEPDASPPPPPPAEPLRRPAASKSAPKQKDSWILQNDLALSESSDDEDNSPTSTEASAVPDEDDGGFRALLDEMDSPSP